MEKKEYAGYWTPEWLSTLRCLSLADKAILARVWSLKEKGAWLTSKTLADQLGLEPSYVRRATGELVKAGWLLSEPFANGLRILKPGPELMGISPQWGCMKKIQPCMKKIQGCVKKIHRDIREISEENTDHTCPAEPGPPHSSQTDPDPNPEIVCSKNGSGSENQAVPRRAAAFDAYDEDDVERALEICLNSPAVAFPFPAALGLLGRWENDRYGH